MELAAGWADEKQLFTYLDLEQDGESGAFAALLLVFICVVSESYRLIHCRLMPGILICLASKN